MECYRPLAMPLSDRFDRWCEAMGGWGGYVQGYAAPQHDAHVR